MLLRLDPRDGDSIWGDACGEIPITDRTSLDTVVVTEPPVFGLTVPVAALRSRADGAVVVIDRAGAEIRVEVVASVGGVAVVVGVAADIGVRVPAGEGPG